MNRREFIAGLGGAATWTFTRPLAAEAQRAAVPVIGILSTISRETTLSLAPFLDGLKETGFIDGQNVRIEFRSAGGRYDRLPTLAADLVDRRVAVLVAIGGPFIAKPVMAATSTIPIVFQGGGPDPVKEGMVASLAHPGGNVTGVMNLSGPTLGAKQVELLRALLPTAPSLGLLVNNTGPGKDSEATAEEAARALQWEVHAEYATDDDGLERAFARLAERGVGGLVVVGDAFFVGRRTRIVALAARYALPASYYFREFVLEGGLMSYGPDLRETNRIAGRYAGRILKGAKPADLPVQQATRIDLALNLKTAKALGLTIPTNLLVRADEVIE
jgi:putative tryptophan/tyrosine transport system substrate-binding protein